MYLAGYQNRFLNGFNLQINTEILKDKIENRKILLIKR